ncbi:MAG: hypothetical protein LBT04_07770 [Prevotellaceae bacterium]|nr:hypothetical protein [Prevotellaceae bacterium]
MKKYFCLLFVSNLLLGCALKGNQRSDTDLVFAVISAYNVDLLNPDNANAFQKDSIQ